MSDLTRLLTGYYNSRSVSVSNPGGMGNDGQELNFPLALADVGTVAQTVGTNAVAAAASAGVAHDDRVLADADVIAAAGSVSAAAAIAAGVAGTSTTAQAIATGSITLTSQTGKQWRPGMFVIAVDHASPTTRWMTGYCTAYDAVTTGNISFTVPGNGTLGSGTPAQYDIFLSGAAGATGAQGVTGGAISEDYIFDTGTANANPGAGKLRLNATPQSTATAIYVSTTDINGGDMTALLDSLGASGSVNKGQLRLANKTDPAKWEVLNLAGVIPHTGYRELTVTALQASPSTSPFGLGDGVVLLFTRTGDAGLSSNSASLLNASAGAALTANARYGVDTGASGPITNPLPAAPALNDTVEAEDEAGFCGRNPATFQRNGNLINGAAKDFDLNVNRGRVKFAWRAGLIGWRATV